MKSIEIPLSKSYFNRFLILASLKNGQKEIKGICHAQDCLDLKRCLIKTGLEIKEDKNSFKILNSFPDCAKGGDLYPGDGGTTTRFLLVLCALSDQIFKIHLSSQMEKRPIDTLISILKNLGVRVVSDKNIIEIQGPFKLLPEEIKVDCSQTTQFYSALKLVLNQKLKPINLSSSRKYIEISDYCKQASEYKTPADFSSLSYALLYGLFVEDTLISNISEIDSLQEDSIFIDLANRIGGNISLEKKGLVVRRSNELQGFDLEAQNCLDLVPSLVVLAANIPHQSFIRNIKNLQFKESNRLIGCLELLSSYDVLFDYCEIKDVLRINGRAALEQKVVNLRPESDHRMVMASYLFQRINGGGDLSNQESVKKSYPGFFSDFKEDEK